MKLRRMQDSLRHVGRSLLAERSTPLLCRVHLLLSSVNPLLHSL